MGQYLGTPVWGLSEGSEPSYLWVSRAQWGLEFEFSFTSVVVRLLSCVQLFATPWTTAHQTSLSFTVSWSLLKLMSTESVIRSNHLILCHPLLLLSSVFPTIRDFSSELAFRIRWPKYWSFGISPSIEYSGLISFRIDWCDLFAVHSLCRVFSSTTVSLEASLFSLCHSILYRFMLPTYCVLRAPCGGAGVEDTFPGLRVLLGEVCHPLIPPPMGTVYFALRAGFPLPSPAKSFVNMVKPAQPLGTPLFTFFH